MPLATPYNIFRLLVPAKDIVLPNAPTIELEGTLWTTTDDSPLFDDAVPLFSIWSQEN